MTVFFACVFVKRFTDKANSLPELNSDMMNNVSTLLVFFTVFRNGNAYSKFYSQFNHATQVSSTVRECAYFAKSMMLPFDETAGATLVRLANLCHLCAYVGLSPHYNGQTFHKITEQYSLLMEHEERCLNDVWDDEDDEMIPNSRTKVGQSFIDSLKLLAHSHC
jgi:hypothetical protein